MTDSFPLEHVPGVSIVDVRPGVSRRRLGQLQDVHQRWFPDHPHVIDEMADAWAEGPFDPDVAVHQWLLLVEEKPRGLFIFHVNLRRGVVVRHFLAMDEEVRQHLDEDWARHLIDACERQARLDALPRGVDIIALMSEIDPEQPRLLAHWASLGHRAFPEIDYREPFHGKHWAIYGEPQYFPMIANIYLTSAGAALPIGEVVEAAVSAFLLDHYRLPPDDPVVAEILARALLLSDPSVESN